MDVIVCMSFCNIHLCKRRKNMENKQLIYETCKIMTKIKNNTCIPVMSNESMCNVNEVWKWGKKKGATCICKEATWLTCIICGINALTKYGGFKSSDY
jgi:hypothetical protein